MMELEPIDIYILLHIKKAQVEYAKMIMKMTELDLQWIQDSIDKLMDLGLLERDSGSAIKRTKARFKRASEVHKHHTYYKLSREGSLFVRDINKEYLRNYFNSHLGKNGFNIIISLKENNFEGLCKKFDLNCETIFKILKDFHFITRNGNRTRFFNKFVAFTEL